MKAQWELYGGGRWKSRLDIGGLFPAERGLARYVVSIPLQY